MSTQKEIPNALIFANDRPTSLDDDLYQWAVVAEDLIRAQHELIQKLKAALAMALPAVEHFKFLEDGAYGKNFSEFRSIKTRSDLRYVKEALAAAEAHK